jgi:hypothetical protein
MAPARVRAAYPGIDEQRRSQDGRYGLRAHQGKCVLGYPLGRVNSRALHIGARMLDCMAAGCHPATQRSLKFIIIN